MSFIKAAHLHGHDWVGTQEPWSVTFVRSETYPGSCPEPTPSVLILYTLAFSQYIFSTLSVHSVFRLPLCYDLDPSSLAPSPSSFRARRPDRRICSRRLDTPILCLDQRTVVLSESLRCLSSHQDQRCMHGRCFHRPSRVPSGNRDHGQGALCMRCPTQ